MGREQTMPESMPEYVIQGIMVLAIVFVLLITLYVVNRIIRNREFPADPIEDFAVKESMTTLVTGIGYFLFSILILIITPKVILANFEISYFVVLFYIFSGILAILGVYYTVSWIVRDIRVEGDTLTCRRLFLNSSVISISNISRIRFKEGSVQRGKVEQKVMHFFDSSDKRLLSVRNTQVNYESLYQRVQFTLARRNRAW